MCYTVCAVGFSNTSDGQCIRCPMGCTSCNFAGECFNCSANLVLYNLQCLSACVFNQSLGSYLNSSNCVSCPSACTSCLNSTQCIRCALPNLYLGSYNGCVANCLSNEYPDNNTFLCQPCPPSCVSCTSALSCTSCTLQLYGYLFYLYRGSCYQSCPNGTYA